MKVAIIYNKDFTRVINKFGMQNKETYNPKTIRLVADALISGGHNVEIIDGNMHVIEALQDFMPKVLEGEKMGMVFNMAYGIQGESRYTHLPSLLEMLGIPYVGSTPAGHALALDKVITKIIMQKNNIPTPNFYVFNTGDEDMSDVEFPVIVKPKMEAVSFGLRVVHTKEELKEAVEFIVTKFQQQALVEQFIRGREFAIGILGNNPIEIFPVLEIDLDNNPDAIQTVGDKRSTPRNKICPANLPADLAEKMQQLSKDAFKALGLRDFSRVDIRMNEKNEIFLLEINSMASLGRTGSYSYAAQAAGYNYNDLVNKMLEVAAVRYFASQALPDIQKGKTIPVHTRIRGFLHTKQPALEKLLMKFVNCNTYVRNIEGVNNFGSMIKKEILSLGFSCKNFPQVEIGNSLFFSNSASDAIDILLIGNLDNAVRQPKQKNFLLSGQKILGSGIWEHKGGILVLIAALQSLKFIKKLNSMRVGILLTSDESLQGQFTRNMIKSFAFTSKYVLGLHGAFLNGGVVTSRSGSAVYSLTMKLSEEQSAYAHTVSDSSSVFCRIIYDLVKLSNQETGLVIAPHSINFGSNITDPHAHGEALISVRFNNQQDLDKLEKKISIIQKSKQYKLLYNLQFDGGIRRPPMNKNDNTEQLFTRLKSLADLLDIRLLEEHRWSSGDISFIDTSENLIDGLGPVGEKPDHEQEFILRHSITERAALLAMTFLELTKKRGK